jgi:hypothetical protein
MRRGGRCKIEGRELERRDKRVKTVAHPQLPSVRRTQEGGFGLCSPAPRLPAQFFKRARATRNVSRTVNRTYPWHPPRAPAAVLSATGELPGWRLHCQLDEAIQRTSESRRGRLADAGFRPATVQVALPRLWVARTGEHVGNSCRLGASAPVPSVPPGPHEVTGQRR